MSTTKLATEDSGYFCWRDYGLIYTENQDSMGFCWSYTSMKALEGAVFVRYGEYYNFSEAWIGLAHSNIEPFYINGKGGTIESAYKVIKEYGVVLESDMSDEVMYSVGSNNAKDILNIYSQYAIRDIFENLVIDNIVLTKDDNSDINLVKSALLRNGILYSAMSKYSFVNETKYSYIKSNPDADSGHATTIIGWDDNISVGSYTGCFIALNSWGNDWGNDGVYYMPYELIGTTVYTVAGFDFIEDADVVIELQTFENKSANVSFENKLHNVGQFSKAVIINSASVLTKNSLQRNITSPGFAINYTYKIKNNTNSEITVNDVEVFYGLNKSTSFSISSSYPFKISSNSYDNLIISRSTAFDVSETGIYKILIHIDTNGDAISDYKVTKLVYCKDDIAVEYIMTGTTSSLLDYSKMQLYLNSNNISFYMPGSERITIYPGTYSTIYSVSCNHGSVSSSMTNATISNDKTAITKFASGSVKITGFNFNTNSTIVLTIKYYAQSASSYKFEEKSKTITITPYITTSDNNKSFDYNSAHYTRIFQAVDENTTIKSLYKSTSYNYSSELYLDTPTKEGYNFDGWYFDKELKNGVKSISGNYYIKPNDYAPSSITDMSEYIKCVGDTYRNTGKNPDSYVYSYYMILYPKWTINSGTTYNVTVNIPSLRNGNGLKDVVYVNHNSFKAGITIVAYKAGEQLNINFVDSKLREGKYYGVSNIQIEYKGNVYNESFDGLLENHVINNLSGDVVITIQEKSKAKKLILTYDTTFYDIDSLDVFRTYYFLIGESNLYEDKDCLSPLQINSATGWPDLPILQKSSFDFSAWCTYPTYYKRQSDGKIVNGAYQPYFFVKDGNKAIKNNNTGNYHQYALVFPSILGDYSSNGHKWLVTGNNVFEFDTTDIILFPVLSVDSSKVHSLFLYDNSPYNSSDEILDKARRHYYFIQGCNDIFIDSQCLVPLAEYGFSKNDEGVRFSNLPTYTQMGLAMSPGFNFLGWCTFPNFYYDGSDKVKTSSSYFNKTGTGSDSQTLMFDKNGCFRYVSNLEHPKGSGNIDDGFFDFTSSDIGWYTDSNYNFNSPVDIVLYPVIVVDSSKVHTLNLCNNVYFKDISSLDILETYYFIEGSSNLYIDQDCLNRLTIYGYDRVDGILWSRLPTFSDLEYSGINGYKSSTFKGWVALPKFYDISEDYIYYADYNYHNLSAKFYDSEGKICIDTSPYGHASTISYCNYSDINAFITSSGFQANYNIYLFPLLIPTNYEIEFDLGGGAFESTIDIPNTFKIESSNIQLPIPTREGYIFAGWKTVNDIYNIVKKTEYGYEETEFVDIIYSGSYGDITFQAQWKKVNKLNLSNYFVYDNNKTISQNIAELSVYQTYYYLKDDDQILIYEDHECTNQVDSLSVPEMYEGIFQGWSFYPKYYYELYNIDASSKENRFHTYEFYNDTTGVLTDSDGKILQYEDDGKNKGWS